MKAQLIQCSCRPRVEPYCNGERVTVTFSDLSGSKVEVELIMAHMISLGNDLLEHHRLFIANGKQRKESRVNA